MKDWTKATDDELFEELRSIVNQSRNTGTHNRENARAVAAEIKRRHPDFNLPKP
jgi:hypothetical protein